MSRDWSEYNQMLVKRGEILISPPFTRRGERQGKKKGRLYTYFLDLEE